MEIKTIDLTKLRNAEHSQFQTEFKELVEKEGLKAFTVVALSIDYASVFSNYKESDRPIRVMEEIYGSRDAFFIGYLRFTDSSFHSKFTQQSVNNDLEM